MRNERTITPSLLIAPALIFGLGGVVWVVLMVGGWQHLVDELVVAVVVGGVSALLACVPMALVGGDVARVSQASLAGSVVHMLSAAAMAGTAWLLRLSDQLTAYAAFVVGFFWVSLIVVVWVMARAIRRSAPPNQL